MRHLRLFLVLFLSCLLARCALAQEIPESYTAKKKVAMGSFGTASSLCLYDDFSAPGAAARYEALWEEIKSLLEEMDQLLSTSISTSEIARFNALPSGQSIKISPMTAEVFALARQMYEKTNGYYNPAVFPLVDLWGFSPRFTYGTEEAMPYDRAWTDGALPLPQEKYIEGFLALADMDGIVLSGSAEEGYTLTKNTPSIVIDGVSYHAQIDLGGIAKGYAVDLAAGMIEEAGYEYGYFSCGSSSIRLLKSASSGAKKSKDPSFQLQVRIPRETETTRDAYALIRVMGKALSSSGDYDHNYITAGSLCSHIISPFTGCPLNFAKSGVQQGICTVTLLGASAAEDDALTTALCLMGPELAIEYVNKNLREHSVALVLYRADQDFYEVITNIKDSDLLIQDAAYRLASRVDEQGNIVYTGTLFAP